ncbi:hypothetical protein D3C78_436310 [compost metagenome]
MEVGPRAGEGGDGAGGDHPGLGIDPLEQGALEEPQGAGRGVSRHLVGGAGNQPGEIEQIEGADALDDEVQAGEEGEQLAKTQPHQQQHQGEADADPHEQRQAAPDPEVGAGAHHHDVVRSRGDRCRDGKEHHGVEIVHEILVGDIPLSSLYWGPVPAFKSGGPGKKNRLQYGACLQGQEVGIRPACHHWAAAGPGGTLSSARPLAGS